MRKKSFIFKKIGKQILYINSLIESFFNGLRQFIFNIKKFKYSRNNKVFLAIVSVVFLTLIYLLIPTAYNKELIKEQIKNQVYQKYNINLNFVNKIQYNFFPKPNFSSKDLSLIHNQKKIADIRNFKIYINFKNFFNFNKIKTKDLIIGKTDFYVKKNDLNFFTDLLNSEPNRDKINIKKGNIFFTNNDDEVLFINQINDSHFRYDFKNLQNILISKSKVFNVPYKLIIRNDKLNEIFEFDIASKKLVLKVENETDYKKKDHTGSFKISFKNKNNIFNYKISENTLDVSTRDNNKILKGQLEFKPFYLISNFDYQTLRIKDLINNPFFIEILKSQILNNKNLNAQINFKVDKLYDLKRFSDLSLDLIIEEGNYNFSNSKFVWKKNVHLLFLDTFLNFDKEKIYLNGKILFDVKDKDGFYKFFQINKDLRKKFQKIELDFNYNLNDEKITFHNFRIDSNSNKEIEEIISNFNLNKKNFVNKIIFKNLVNDILIAYFG